MTAVKEKLMQRGTWFLALVLAVSACGGDEPPKAPPPKPAGGPSASGPKPPGAPAAPAALAKGAKPLVTYPKVAQELRRDLAKADFTPDPTGDIVRDPFRSYLVEAAGVASATSSEKTHRIQDECDKRTVADSYGLRDLRLVGVVLRGTKTYALFTDGHQFGHIAHRNDCLSKDKARIRDIGTDRVILEIRGEAPPGAPAPPPREEVWRLHPEELELANDQINLPSAPIPAPDDANEGN